MSVKHVSSCYGVFDVAAAFPQQSVFLKEQKQERVRVEMKSGMTEDGGVSALRDNKRMNRTKTSEMTGRRLSLPPEALTSREDTFGLTTAEAVTAARCPRSHASPTHSRRPSLHLHSRKAAKVN